MTRLAIHRRRLLWLTGAAGMAAMPFRARAAADPSIIAPIRQLCDTLIRVMQMGASQPFERRFDALAPAIDAAFDLDFILQLSVGLGWGALPPDQKAKLESAFRRYTIASYLNSFDSFTGQRFEVSPDTRILSDGDQVVQTKIIPRSGDSHELDYVMRRTPQGWKAVDVLEDGTISRVAVQRSDFRQLLLHGGAPALLKSLQDKTSELSGAA
jgi:phospholipid transport system substrate-binding protein